MNVININHKMSRWVFVIGWSVVLVLGLVRCAPGDVGATAEEGERGADASKTATTAPTIQASTTPTPSRTPLLPTFTPLPTLSPTEAEALVQELFETNGGCNLPCWWGITPGESSWNSTIQFLSTFASKIVLLGGRNTGRQSFEINYRYPSIGLNNRIFFSVENNVVDSINIDPDYNNNSFQFQLNKLLTGYGKPEEIFMYLRWPITHPGELHFYPFRLVLHYPDQNIIAYYSFKGLPNNGTVYVCTPSEVLPELFLYSPSSSIDVNKIIQGYIHGRFVEDDEILSLPRMEDYTNMSLDVFYETFADANSIACLETPESFWVGDARP